MKVENRGSCIGQQCVRGAGGDDVLKAVGRVKMRTIVMVTIKDGAKSCPRVVL